MSLQITNREEDDAIATMLPITSASETFIQLAMLLVTPMTNTSVAQTQNGPYKSGFRPTTSRKDTLGPNGVHAAFRRLVTSAVSTLKYCMRVRASAERIHAQRKN